jgi:hypothetical protein
MLSGKEYENIIVKSDKFTEDTLIALGLVKKYVSDNNLLIVGGMAIDLSLKLKGSKLYEDDVLPDYDFYSYEYHKDAYQIAEKLKQAGLENISVINANHTSTMRVRVNYTVVADVTYVPKNIFDNLPYLVFRGIKIIHPHYQMIDQHKALSYPYENSPWEVIAHRWKKDAERYDLLYKFYPLKSKEFKESGEIKFTDEIKISSILFQNQCVGGFAGLLFWEQYAKKIGFKGNKLSLGKIDMDINGFVINIPIDSHGISVYSNNILNLIKDIKKQYDIKKEKQYNRFLDKLPHKFILDNLWEIFDNSGNMLSAYKCDNNIFISNLQNIMSYMLANLILLQKIKNTNRGYSFYLGYINAQEIVKWAGEEYYKLKRKKLLPLLPYAEVYGNEDISDSYINSKRLFLEKVNQREKQQMQPNIIFPEHLKKNKIPSKFYKFIPSNSPILQFDGEETTVYKDRIYL